LLVSNSEKSSLKKLLEEKNKEIENLKNDVWTAKFRNKSNSRNKINVLSFFLGICLIVIIILAANLSNASKKYSSYYSLYQESKSINNDFESENKELIEKYKVLEGKYISIQREDNENEVYEKSTEDIENPDKSLTHEKLAPTVNLVIYEGPIYLKEENICYYRIKANISGKPSPKIEFSKDDSNGAWGENIAQVNLFDSNDSYELTVKVSNSEGIATSSMILEWGCERY